MFVAGRTIKVGTGIRKRGDEVPEAAQWREHVRVAALRVGEILDVAPDRAMEIQLEEQLRAAQSERGQAQQNLGLAKKKRDEAAALVDRLSEDLKAAKAQAKAAEEYLQETELAVQICTEEVDRLRAPEVGSR